MGGRTETGRIQAGTDIMLSMLYVNGGTLLFSASSNKPLHTKSLCWFNYGSERYILICKVRFNYYDPKYMFFLYFHIEFFIRKLFIEYFLSFFSKLITDFVPKTKGQVFSAAYVRLHM